MPRLRTIFDAPLFLLLFLGYVSIWPAADRVAAWGKFGLLVLAVVVYYLIVWWQRRKPAEIERGAAQVAWVLVTLAGALLLYFLLTVDWSQHQAKVALIATVGEALRAVLPRVSADSVHPNVFGGVLAVILPFAVALTLSTRSASRRARGNVAARRARLLALTLTILIGAGIILSQSRAAWMALAIAAFVWVLRWSIGTTLPNSRNQQRAFLVSAIVLVLTVCIIFVTFPEPFLAVLSHLLAEQGRFDLYRQSVMLLFDYPFLGGGLGSFMMTHVTYSYLTHVGFSTHAHNTLLNVSLEMGVGGVLLLVWMGVLFGRNLLGDLKARPLTLWRGAAGFAFLIILLHGLFDDPLYSSRALPLLFVPLAFVAPATKRRRRRKRSRIPSSLVIVAGLLLALTLAVLWQPLASLTLSNWGAVRQSRLELSTYAWPDWPIQDAVRREVDLTIPRAYYEQALAIDPYNVAANRRLGQIALSLGEYEAALTHLERAYTIAPWDNGTRQMWGEALIVTGKVERGTVLWSDVANDRGQLNIRAYWYGSLGDGERRERINQALASIAP